MTEVESIISAIEKLRAKHLIISNAIHDCKTAIKAAEGNEYALQLLYSDLKQLKENSFAVQSKIVSGERSMKEKKYGVLLTIIRSRIGRESTDKLDKIVNDVTINGAKFEPSDLDIDGIVDKKELESLKQENNQLRKNCTKLVTLIEKARESVNQFVDDNSPQIDMADYIIKMKPIIKCLPTKAEIQKIRKSGNF